MAGQAGPGRRGPRRALSEDEILDVALALLDEGGVDAASIRGIAARVGIAPNAVYTYFPGKAAVVQALVDRILGEVNHDVFADRTQPWRRRVECLALELRQRLAAHPGAVPLMVSHPLSGRHALALNERLLDLLADAGLRPPDAAHASHLLLAYVLGAIALDTAGHPDAATRAPLPSEHERTAAARHISALSARSRRPRGPRDESLERYLWGLHRLLNSIATAA